MRSGGHVRWGEEESPRIKLSPRRDPPESLVAEQRRGLLSPDLEEIEEESRFAIYYRLIADNPAFRWIWIASIFNLLGDMLVYIATMVQVGGFTSSATAISILLIVRFLPPAVFAPWAGVVADQYDRAKVMVVSSLVVAVATVGFLLVQSKSMLWIVFIVTFIQFTGAAFFEPARRALIPVYVDEEDLVAANTLESVTGSLCYFIGSVAGGFITSMFGYSVDYIIDALLFVISAASVMMVTQFPPRVHHVSEVYSPDTPPPALTAAPASSQPASARKPGRGLGLLEPERGPKPAAKPAAKPSSGLLAEADDSASASASEKEEEWNDPLLGKPARLRDHPLSRSKSFNDEEELIAVKPSPTPSPRFDRNLQHETPKPAAIGAALLLPAKKPAASAIKGRTRSGHVSMQDENAIDEHVSFGGRRSREPSPTPEATTTTTTAITVNGGNADAGEEDELEETEGDYAAVGRTPSSIGNSPMVPKVTAARMFMIGVRYLWRNPVVLIVVLMKGLWAVVWGGGEVVNMKMAESNLRIGADASIALAWVNAVTGIASGLGPIMADFYSGNSPLRQRVSLVSAFICLTLGTLVLAIPVHVGITFNMTFFLVGNFLRNLGAGVVWVMSSSWLQLMVPDRLRGRIFALELGVWVVGEIVSPIWAGVAMDDYHSSAYAVYAQLGVLSLFMTVGWSVFLYRLPRYADHVTGAVTPFLGGPSPFLGVGAPSPFMGGKSPFLGRPSPGHAPSYARSPYIVSVAR